MTLSVRLSEFFPGAEIFLRFSLDKYPIGVYNVLVKREFYRERVIKMESKTPCECFCEKKTERSETERKKLMNRLNRIEGQVRGICGMVERDAYCADILTQCAAVSAALNAFNRELIANHLRHCVARDLRAGKDEVIDELVDTLQKLMK